MGPDDGVALFVVEGEGLGEGDGARPDLVDGVKLFVAGSPDGGKALHDGVVWDKVFDLEGLLRAVAAGGDAEAFTPFVGLERSEGVHGAMDHDGGHARAVGGDDLLDESFVADVGEAFVMNDDVVALGPARGREDADLMVGGGAAFVDDGPLHAGAGAHAFGDDLFLGLVVMTAAAGDQEGAEGARRGFGELRAARGGVCGTRAEDGDDGEERGFHDVLEAQGEMMLNRPSC